MYGESSGIRTYMNKAIFVWCVDVIPFVSFKDKHFISNEELNSMQFSRLIICKTRRRKNYVTKYIHYTVVLVEGPKLDQDFL